jgi:hypothetical protein
MGTGQVTLGYLLRRASTSGGHCKVSGGCGELSGGGETTTPTKSRTASMTSCGRAAEHDYSIDSCLQGNRRLQILLLHNETIQQGPLSKRRRGQGGERGRQASGWPGAPPTGPR